MISAGPATSAERRRNVKRRNTRAFWAGLFAALTIVWTCYVLGVRP